MRNPPSRTLLADWYELEDKYCCMRCSAENVQTERAHLVDYCSTRANGLDDEIDNYVLLCPRCHGEMPAFDVGEYYAACLWVLSTHDSSYYRTLANYGVDRLGWETTDDIDLGAARSCVRPEDLLCGMKPAFSSTYRRTPTVTAVTGTRG